MTPQQLVDQLRRDTGDLFLMPDIPTTTLFLVSEVGEVCDCVIRLMEPDFLRSNPGVTESNLLANLEMELGDVLLMLATLATQYNIYLEDALCRAIAKVRRRYEEAKNEQAS